MTDDHVTEVAGAESYQSAVVDASNEQPVLVDFWSARCAPCVQLTPWVESIAARMTGSARVVKVDSMQNRRLCVDLGVLGLPTFIMYAKGKEFARLSGDECSEVEIERVLQQALDAHRLQGTA